MAVFFWRKGPYLVSCPIWKKLEDARFHRMDGLEQRSHQIYILSLIQYRYIFEPHNLIFLYFMAIMKLKYSKNQVLALAVNFKSTIIYFYIIFILSVQQLFQRNSEMNYLFIFYALKLMVFKDIQVSSFFDLVQWFYRGYFLAIFLLELFII